MLSRKWIAVAGLTLGMLSVRIGWAADLEDAQKALGVGNHARCIEISDKAIKNRALGEEFYLLKATAENQTGEYRAAYDTIVDGLARYSWSIRMRLVGLEAARMSGQAAQASVWQTEIADFAGRLRGDIRMPTTSSRWTAPRWKLGWMLATCSRNSTTEP